MQDVAQGFEELKTRVGTKVGVTDWFTIEQKMADVFGVLTGNPDAMHNDPEWAKSSPWGGTIAHGMNILCLIPQFWKDCGLPLVTSEHMYTLNYGFDRVRFTAPLRIGQRARAHIVLDEVRKRGDDAYLVKSTYSVEVENSERPCMVAQQLSLFVMT